MQTRPLGNTGLQVTVIGFGGMTIGGAFGPVDDAESTAALHAAPSLVLFSAITLTGCSDGADSASDAEKTDHVWKDQTQAIDKARDVQRQLDQSRK